MVAKSESDTNTNGTHRNTDKACVAHWKKECLNTPNIIFQLAVQA